MLANPQEYSVHRVGDVIILLPKTVNATVALDSLGRQLISSESTQVESGSKRFLGYLAGSISKYEQREASNAARSVGDVIILLPKTVNATVALDSLGRQLISSESTQVESGSKRFLGYLAGSISKYEQREASNAARRSWSLASSAKRDRQLYESVMRRFCQFTGLGDSDDDEDDDED